MPVLPERGFAEEGDTWVKKIHIELNSPGIYHLHCIGAVWNTSEWANRTKTIIVKGKF